MNNLRPHRYSVLTKILKINYVITRSAIDLAYKIHGPSPTSQNVPIFVLHGLLGSKKNWESMSKKISAGMNKTVVAVDARNHGDSPHSDAHDYPDLASDVSRLITSLGLNQVTIIGHSMGGRTGMCLALAEPSKVKNLIVADISPVSTAGILNDFFPRLIDVMKSVNFDGLDNLHKAKNIAKDKILKSGLIKNVEGMHFILMNIGQLQNKSFGWKCNLDALKQHFISIASFPNMDGKQFLGPTLFIGGKLSNYIPPDDITGIQKLFPKAQLQYIEGVGHNVHAEDPNAFYSLVMNFLSSNK